MGVKVFLRATKQKHQLEPGFTFPFGLVMKKSWLVYLFSAAQGDKGMDLLKDTPSRSRVTVTVADSPQMQGKVLMSWPPCAPFTSQRKVYSFGFSMFTLTPMPPARQWVATKENVKGIWVALALRVWPCVSILGSFTLLLGPSKYSKSDCSHELKNNTLLKAKKQMTLEKMLIFTEEWFLFLFERLMI